ncbi:TAP-like protein [Microlunatus sagamiharensis]|uniref:TAP-like protein n=1 Tax=Microlunatus sagamiharensis TaxID=546874 RepID=A0A1H2NFR2_9ACTN|nr:TAP-like protein [Microlunatus sagamiharensis]
MRSEHTARRGRPTASAVLVLGVLVVVAVLLAGCGVLPVPTRSPASPDTGSSAPSAPSASTAPSSVAPTPADGRPLEPVPAVVPPGVTDPPAGSGPARYTGQRLDWQPCSQRAECASVSAPLDWSAPDGRALTLVVGRIRATASPRLGTLFINPGGPGGSGLSLLGGFPTQGLEHYDVASWDPRGVGRSTPVRCSGGADLDRLFSLDVSPDDDAEASVLNTAARDLGRSCLAGSGALLEHISTADTVRDLDLLRGLVGDERLHYLGFSYGTQIGAQYADTFPARTGPMVLDGAVDLDDASKVSQIQGFERALGHFATWCADQRCGLGDDRAAVLDTVKRLLTRLDASPLPGSGDRVLTQQLGLSGVLTPLYDGTSGWPRLAEALGQAVRGQGAGLLALADRGNERDRDGSYGSIATAFPAIRCLDSQATSVADADRKARALVSAAPVLGPFSGPDVFCPLWPVAPAPEARNLHRVGDRPVLVVGTTGDPATPYEYAVAMARRLDSAVLLTNEGEGHTGYGSSACVQRVVQAYLNEGRVPASGARCTAG